MEPKKDNLKKVKDNQADEPPLSETESKNASDDALPSETAEKSKEKAKSEKPKKKKGKKVTISVGSSVKLTGSYYADGEKILNSEKKRVLKVGKINGNKAYLPQVDGWVYISTLSLVS